MAKVVDPRTMPDPEALIPGLKPPVRDFAPSDDGDPSEVDAFIKMIRAIFAIKAQRQTPVWHERAGLDTNVVSILF